MKKALDQIKKDIPEKDRESQSIVLLLELAEEQNATILALKEQNQILRDEIARLKNHKPKPKIKPSR